jgi:hypothetical protein
VNWWSALLGGLIGAGIPGSFTYLGMRRSGQAADAEAFGPAVLLLDRINPDRVLINLNPDPAAEAAKWAELQPQLDTARAAAGCQRRQPAPGRAAACRVGRSEALYRVQRISLGRARHASQPRQ